MRRPLVVALGGFALVLVLLFLTSPVLAQDCCGAPAPVKSDASAPQVTVHKVTEAEVGTEAVCPIMGDKLKIALNTLAVEYKGKVYYFCCGGCPAKFKADPEKYAAKAAQPEQQH